MPFENPDDRKSKFVPYEDSEKLNPFPDTPLLRKARHDVRWATSEILRLREIVRLYADPQQMKPEHKAFVETFYDVKDESNA